MAVGIPASDGSINSALTKNALALRDIMVSIAQLQEFMVALGLTGLEAIGFSSADAATALSMASYMNTVAGCYLGTVQQGGTGGTGAITFNFDNALCPLWGGQ
jgi:hypothetical protein